MKVETSTPHRHRFDTNSDRTERTCRACNVRQVKVSGKWTVAAEEDAATCPYCAPDEKCALHTTGYFFGNLSGAEAVAAWSDTPDD